MKKRYTLICATLLALSAQAQDTLFYESFESQSIDYILQGTPPGNTTDTMGYNFDLDGLPDASPSNPKRPGEWFLTKGIADVDSSKFVLGSNSWTNNATTPVENWLILPSVYIADTTAKLSWKSAPFQTPRYMDGYMVVIGSTDNIETSLTDTVFLAAEFISGDSSFLDNYSKYTFSKGFVHGADGLFVEENANTSKYRKRGVLRPFEVSLKKYAGKNVFVGFVHKTHDDNILTIDELLITGTKVTGINEVATPGNLNLFPNPAHDFATLSFELPKATSVNMQVLDQQGKLVLSQSSRFFLAGSHRTNIDIRSLAKGNYQVVLQTAQGQLTKQLVVVK